MKELLREAAPVLAIMAYKGGSLFAMEWVKRARALGVVVEIPNDDTGVPDNGRDKDN